MIIQNISPYVFDLEWLMGHHNKGYWLSLDTLF